MNYKINIFFTCSRKLWKFGITACNEGQVLEVLDDGLVVECAAVVQQVAEGAGDASSLT
jgi:hypothetical protein